MVIRAKYMMLVALVAGCAGAAEFERLPNQRLIVLSDMHGICSTRHIPGVRRTVHQMDFVTYTIEYSSRTVAGAVRGSFGEIEPETVAGFAHTSMDSPEGPWTLLTGRRGSELVMVRESVAGTIATVVVEKDHMGVRAEALELLRSMTSCEAMLSPR